MSLPEQGTDPLQVFPMGTELHREREEVAKVSVMDTSLHMKGIPAPSCLQGGLCSLLSAPVQPSSVLLDKHLTPAWTAAWDQLLQPFGSRTL